MSALRSVSLLVFKHNQSVKDAGSCLRRLNDIVDVSPFSSLKGVCECLLVICSLFYGVFTPENNLDCALRAHDCNL